MVANDPQRCILCKRCTRVCDEWMGEDAIEAGGRGANTVIGTYGGWLNCSQCGNCIEVCPTGTLLDATYRHQTRPWELAQNDLDLHFLLGRLPDVARLAPRRGDAGRGARPLRQRPQRRVSLHQGALRAPVRQSRGASAHAARFATRRAAGSIPATWEEAVRFASEKLREVTAAHGGDSVGVVGSPRLTNEANYALLKFAREVVGTDKYTATEAFSLVPFFENLSAPLATHRDIRHAKTIVLIGGEPEELQPLTGKQIRQAVRNGGAKLVIVNSTPIRLKQQAAQFIHIRPGSEDAAVLALASPGDAKAAARKLGVEPDELAQASQLISETAGDVVVMFGGELSAEAQAVLAQLPASFGEKEGRRFLLHPLPHLQQQRRRVTTSG